MHRLLTLGLIAALGQPSFSQGTTPVLPVPAGTGVEIELLQDMSSESIKAGQTIAFKLVRPIELDGKTLFTAGAPVTGVVETVRTSGKWGRAGAFKLTLQPLKLSDGMVIHLDFPHPQKKGEKAEKVGEVIVGALYEPNYLLFPAWLIAGTAIKGKSFTVRSGERYLVYVTSTEAGPLPVAGESPKR